jgi:hypothetical protein
MSEPVKAPPGHIIDDQGNVRKVLGTLPVTRDGCVVGDVPDHGALVFYQEHDSSASAYRVTLCHRCVSNPDDESKDWYPIENDELDGTGRWFSTREAAEAARGT